MFTGIIEELGRVSAIEEQPDAKRITIEGPIVTSDVSRGDSIAVCGACLTAVELEDGKFTADVMNETLRLTNLGDLKVGDRVLTRDDGAQSVRWIGQTTLRAVGEFAPVVIRKGTLHNENDLMLSPDHRVFIYQREDHLGAGRAEVLVRVRHLINGDTVYQQDGGFVDYFQILFDDHQIIYAEGIAAESLLIDPRTRRALPASVDTQRHSYRHHQDYEVTETLLPSQNAAEILRKASSS
ncbi:MAG: hypothetical protein EBV86_06625 [Marivivens sp.]|nr:hypothetical protein [Marivivens sp.]